MERVVIANYDELCIVINKNNEPVSGIASNRLFEFPAKSTVIVPSGVARTIFPLAEMIEAAKKEIDLTYYGKNITPAKLKKIEVLSIGNFITKYCEEILKNYPLRGVNVS